MRWPSNLACVWLTSSLSTALAVAQIQVPGNALKESPVRILRAEMSSDGSIFVLGAKSALIERHSEGGSLTGGYQVLERGDIRLPTLLDFTVDGSGNVHGLVFSRPHGGRPQTVLVKFISPGASYTSIPLSKSFQAWRLEMDAQGNYYLLGVETQTYLGLVYGSIKTASVDVIHRFSPSGQYISSFLPITVTGKEQFERLILDTLAERTNFVVTASDLWFLHTLKIPEASFGQLPQVLYRVDGQGRVEQVELPPPSPGYVKIGLIKFGSDFAIQWVNSGQTASVLTRRDGYQVGKLDLPARVLCASPEKALTVVSFGSAGFKIFSNRLE